MPRKKSTVEGVAASAKKASPKQAADRRIDDIFKSKRTRGTPQKPKVTFFDSKCAPCRPISACTGGDTLASQNPVYCGTYLIQSLHAFTVGNLQQTGRKGFMGFFLQHPDCVQ